MSKFLKICCYIERVKAIKCLINREILAYLKIHFISKWTNFFVFNLNFITFVGYVL